MLPSTGYLKSINCPFYDSGLCERPYCHFRHVKKDLAVPVVAHSSNADEVEENISSQVGSSDSSEKNILEHLVTEAVKKVLKDNDALLGSLSQGSVDTSKVLQALESSDSILEGPGTKSLIDKVVKGMKPNSQKSKHYMPPPGTPSYKPTPISILKHRNSVPGTVKNSSSKHEECGPQKRTLDKLDGSTHKKLKVGKDDENEEYLPYSAGSSSSSLTSDKNNEYTPSGKISGMREPTYSPGGIKNSDGVQYTPSDKSTLTERDSNYVPCSRNGDTTSAQYKPSEKKATNASEPSYIPKGVLAASRLEYRPSAKVCLKSEEPSYVPVKLNNKDLDKSVSYTPSSQEKTGLEEVYSPQGSKFSSADYVPTNRDMLSVGSKTTQRVSEANICNLSKDTDSGDRKKQSEGFDLVEQIMNEGNRSGVLGSMGYSHSQNKETRELQKSTKKIKLVRNNFGTTSVNNTCPLTAPNSTDVTFSKQTFDSHNVLLSHSFVVQTHSKEELNYVDKDIKVTDSSNYNAFISGEKVVCSSNNVKNSIDKSVKTRLTRDLDLENKLKLMESLNGIDILDDNYEDSVQTASEDTVEVPCKSFKLSVETNEVNNERKMEKDKRLTILKNESSSTAVSWKKNVGLYERGNSILFQNKCRNDKDTEKDIQHYTEIKHCVSGSESEISDSKLKIRKNSEGEQKNREGDKFEPQNIEKHFKSKHELEDDSDAKVNRNKRSVSVELEISSVESENEVDVINKKKYYSKGKETTGGLSEFSSEGEECRENKNVKDKKKVSRHEIHEVERKKISRNCNREKDKSKFEDYKTQGRRKEFGKKNLSSSSGSSSGSEIENNNMRSTSDSEAEGKLSRHSKRKGHKNIKSQRCRSRCESKEKHLERKERSRTRDKSGSANGEKESGGNRSKYSKYKSSSRSGETSVRNYSHKNSQLDKHGSYNKSSSPSSSSNSSSSNSSRSSSSSRHRRHKSYKYSTKSSHKAERYRRHRHHRASYKEKEKKKKSSSPSTYKSLSQKSKSIKVVDTKKEVVTADQVEKFEELKIHIKQEPKSDSEDTYIEKPEMTLSVHVKEEPSSHDENLEIYVKQEHSPEIVGKTEKVQSNDSEVNISNQQICKRGGEQIKMKVEEKEDKRSIMDEIGMQNSFEKALQNSFENSLKKRINQEKRKNFSKYNKAKTQQSYSDSNSSSSKAITKEMKSNIINMRNSSDETQNSSESNKREKNINMNQVRSSIKERRDSSKDNTKEKKSSSIDKGTNDNGGSATVKKLNHFIENKGINESSYTIKNKSNLV